MGELSGLAVEDNRQLPHALSAVKQHTLDICARRWTGVINSVAGGPKGCVPVGILKSFNDGLRVQQCDKMLGQISEGVDLQFGLRKQHRAALRDTQYRPDDPNIALS